MLLTKLLLIRSCRSPCFYTKHLNCSFRVSASLNLLHVVKLFSKLVSDKKYSVKYGTSHLSQFYHQLMISSSVFAKVYENDDLITISSRGCG